MTAIRIEESKNTVCGPELSPNRNGDNHWCEELLARTTEGLLNRIEDEVERGLEEIEYQGFAFDVKDDSGGWTYCYEGFECRSLEEILLYLEGILRQ